MSFTKIWIHLVFTTKYRKPYLKDEIRPVIISHIKVNCRNNNIFLKTIGGYTDHLHCLISLGREQSVAKVAQLIKGESSFWINKNKITPNKFMWQDDYYAVSVNPLRISAVSNYINNQVAHHKKESIAEELEEILKK